MHLIIYGPEGSGKGTQAKLLSEKFRLPIFTSGELVRIAAERNSGTLGESCRQALTKGTYVSDRIMFQLWESQLKTQTAKSGFVIDGFPRNINQAKFLTNSVTKWGYKIDSFIHLKISDEESYKRLKKRNRKLFEGSNISHDTIPRITKRLKIYHQQEKDLLNYFDKIGILIEIDAYGSVERVFESILQVLQG